MSRIHSWPVMREKKFQWRTWKVSLLTKTQQQSKKTVCVIWREGWDDQTRDCCRPFVFFLCAVRHDWHDPMPGRILLSLLMAWGRHKFDCGWCRGISDQHNLSLVACPCKLMLRDYDFARTDLRPSKTISSVFCKSNWFHGIPWRHCFWCD